MMGCSCDWDRQRFTMDAVCSAAVREIFFRLFSDKLIYRGDRLVNWDCQLQTAVADDEVYHETVTGHFWHLRYPIIDPKPGEPEFLSVATTRPETMLGDTAIACHPDPTGALEAKITDQRRKLAEAADRDRGAAQVELDRLVARRESHLAGLEQLSAMARDGRKVRLPLLDREIPLIVDEWAKPELGSGCVKVTPAHAPNDYDVWKRHADTIGIINILNPDGTYNANAGKYQGEDRFVARKRVVSDLDALGLLDRVEERYVDIGHSDRSKTPIEPYLSKQWFVRMGDVDGGVVCNPGGPKEFVTPGLAQAAIDAVSNDWTSPGGKRLEFHPSRYTGQYSSWLSEKRDWCISRQLWWGHQIPVWTESFDDAGALAMALAALPKDDETVRVWLSTAEGAQYAPADATSLVAHDRLPVELQVCLRDEAAQERYAATLATLGLVRDPDVLDTWFSSAVWPFSTLGWPDPVNAPIDAGQTFLGASEGRPSSFEYFYPGSCLVTSRDIITLWVARMVIMGLYSHGEVPFTDCFVHAKILDGKGVTMSKSKGNGVDPVQIIERYGVDAMRYLICDIETGMQDVRLPVQSTCPSCEKTVELTNAEHGRSIFTWVCTHCHAEFDVLGTMPHVPSSSVFSDRFDVGRAFCNKLWNAARFALMNLGEMGFEPLSRADLAPEDRWILARLNTAIVTVNGHLEGYRPSAALNSAREFFWGELCDWYLELVKPRMRDEQAAKTARQVLAVVLDQVLRLLHPFIPFITETIWQRLNDQAPTRGIEAALPDSQLCITAAWPSSQESWADATIEGDFEKMKDVIGRLRELRARHDVAPRKKLPAAIRADGASLAHIEAYSHLVSDMANLESLELGADVTAPENAATALSGELEIFLGGVLDPEKERLRLEGTIAKLQSELARAEKKLSNEKFVGRAPEAVVAAERAKVVEFGGQLEALRKNLDALVQR